MNVLYIDIGGVVDDNYIYQYYGDLYRELKNISNVYYHEGFVRNIHDVFKKYPVKMDCVIFGLGYFAQSLDIIYKQKILGLNNINIPVVCMLHKPQTMILEKLKFCRRNNIDLLVDSQCTYEKHAKVADALPIRIPFTATPKHYHPREVDKVYDLGFCGATHGGDKIKGATKNLRNRIFECLQEKEYNIFWNGQTKPSDRIGSIEEYATKINQSKIWLSTTGPTLDVSPRYFEVMLSKTLLFCNKMDKEYGGMFIDGVNCVMFENDLSDFEDKLEYYLNNEAKRDTIIKTAYDTVLNNYTSYHMACKLLNKIKEIR